MAAKAAVVAAGTANILIACVKFVAAAASASTALLAEGFHSVVDTIDELLLLLGLHLSRRPPDEAHPSGYGQELAFWSTVVGTIIFAVGGGASFYEGLRRVMHGGPLKSATWSYVALSAAAVFESSSLVVGYRRLRRRYPSEPLWEALQQSKDPALFSAVYEDTTAIAGLVVAFVGVLLAHVFGSAVFDGIGAMDDCVHRVGHVLTMHFGPDQVLVIAQLEFRDRLTSDDLERAIDRIESRVREECPVVVTRIYVELESLTRGTGRPGAGARSG